MKIIIFTPTKRNVQFHFSMWVLIKNEYTTIKNVIFTVIKTAINLFMGYSLEMPHVIEPRDTTWVRP